MISKKIYRFAVDEVNGYFLRGWCFNRLAKNRLVELEISADSVTLASGLCNLYRRDVHRLGLHPTGRCGFSINLPEDFKPQEYQKIALGVKGTRGTIYTRKTGEIPQLTPQDSTPVYFMHIPKTAGSSFNAFLQTCYKPSHYHPHIERLEPAAQALLLRRRQGCVSGHLHFERARSMSKLDAYHVLTLLRDPLSHLHSHINYLRRVHLDQELEKEYGFQHNDAIKALAKKLCEIDFSDPQEIQTLVAGLSGYELDFLENIQTRYFLGKRPQRLSEADYEMAQANMDHFSLVGLTEAYDQFLGRFCSLVGLPFQQQSSKSNRADSYRLFDPENDQIRTAFASLITYDQRLYQLVKEKFW